MSMDWLGAVSKVEAILEQSRRACQSFLAELEVYRELLIHMPAIVCRLAPDGTTLLVKDAVATITGYRPEELQGKNWWEVLYPEGERRQVDELYRLFETGNVADHEMTLTAKDGSQRTLLWSSYNQYGTDGKLERIIGFGADITRCKRTERALRESQELYRTLVETSPDAIVLTDMDGRILVCNQRALALFGCESREEMLSRNAIELLALEEHERVRNEMRGVSITKAIRNLECTLLKKDGSRFPVEMSGSLVFDTAGHPEAFIAVLRDITQRKLGEARRQQSEIE